MCKHTHTRHIVASTSKAAFNYGCAVVNQPHSDGRLAQFHLCRIRNNAAVSIFVFLCESLWRYISGGGTAGSKARLASSLLGTSKLLFHQNAQACGPLALSASMTPVFVTQANLEAGNACSLLSVEPLQLLVT